MPNPIGDFDSTALFVSDLADPLPWNPPHNRAGRENRLRIRPALSLTGGLP